MQRACQAADNRGNSFSIRELGGGQSLCEMSAPATRVDKTETACDECCAIVLRRGVARRLSDGSRILRHESDVDPVADASRCQQSYIEGHIGRKSAGKASKRKATPVRGVTLPTQRFTYRKESVMTASARSSQKPRDGCPHGQQELGLRLLLLQDFARRVALDRALPAPAQGSGAPQRRGRPVRHAPRQSFQRIRSMLAVAVAPSNSFARLTRGVTRVRQHDSHVVSPNTRSD